jgi:hypothetical protein
MRWHEDLSNADIRPGETGTKSYLGPAPGVGERGAAKNPEPQAFLVEMGSETPTLRVHYHPVDQFQLFVRGGGRFGAHRVDRWTVHYSDRFTPYGPLLSDEDGLAFLTLRAASNNGAFYMPEAREELAGSLADVSGQPRRSSTFALGEVAATVHSSRWEDVISADDGLRIVVGRVESSRPVIWPEIEGAGAYVILLSGQVLTGGLALGEGSIGWADPGDNAHAAESSTEGATIALLQFPMKQAA